ncbi:hypothetical protein AVEN_70890-1 [Araneus ventricosus]|uniref:Uncharacterized protein n=1 Tax=Araneus ventricosus TaxID=182803 RepID=A0A4Y2UZF4_ARAVE|nr:hypothetical protein AVEN_70890-1 [Araneus ventricosus]
MRPENGLPLHLESLPAKAIREESSLDGKIKTLATPKIGDFREQYENITDQRPSSSSALQATDFICGVRLQDISGIFFVANSCRAGGWQSPTGLMGQIKQKKAEGRNRNSLKWNILLLPEPHPL